MCDFIQMLWHLNAAINFALTDLPLLFWSLVGCMHGVGFLSFFIFFILQPTVHCLTSPERSSDTHGSSLWNCENTSECGNQIAFLPFCQYCHFLAVRTAHLEQGAVKWQSMSIITDLDSISCLLNYVWYPMASACFLAWFLQSITTFLQKELFNDYVPFVDLFSASSLAVPVLPFYFSFAVHHVNRFVQ